jgi:hypothetical protein
MKVSFKKDNKATEYLLFAHAYKDLSTENLLKDLNPKLHEMGIVEKYVREIMESPTACNLTDAEMQLLKEWLEGRGV